MSKTKTKKFINISIGIVIFLAIFANFSYAMAYSAGDLVSMTNSARARNGLGALSTNSALSSAAYAKAQDMLANNYFAHTSPSGKTPWDFIRGAGYDYTYAGENLAIGYTDANELFSAWMASVTHRENILNPNFREVGIAVVSGTYDGAETIVVAQEFGTQESSSEQVAAGQASPEAVNISSSPAEGESATPKASASPANITSQSFQFVKDKSTFNPQTIFTGEEVSFQVTVSGEVQSLEIQVFGKNFNLLETSSVSGDQEKTYVVKQKIENEGSTDVNVVASDKFGNRQSLNLGKLEAKKTVISKNNSEGNNQTLLAGFKDSVKNHWFYFVLGVGLLLAGLGLLIFRKIKFGHFLAASWKF